MKTPLDQLKQWEFFYLGLGTILLCFTLVGLAVLGHLQGEVYRKYQTNPSENMLYLHLMPLPLFILIGDDLGSHFTLWNQSEPFFLFGFSIPWLWFLVLLNILTQYICIKGVHNTTAILGTLSCTFATTVRKFFSLIFSVFYFQNYFTSIHWIGTSLVFYGTYMFAVAPTSQKKSN